MKRFYYFLIASFLFACNTGGSETISKQNKERRIAFVSNRSGNPEIYVMNEDGSKLKQLTHHDSLDYSPAWSADNKFIFFYSKRTGICELYRMTAEGEELTKLTNNDFQDVLPNPSPNGNQILFMRDIPGGSRDVYLLNMEDSTERALTSNLEYEESPSWSADGKKILFTKQLRDSGDASHAANGEIFIMNMVDATIQRLTIKGGYDSGAKFSPDGKKIAFYGSSEWGWDLFTMNADGSDIENLTQDSVECYSPDWTSDGKSLIYTAGYRGNYNLYSIDLESKIRTQLTNTDGRNEGPSCSR